jgi:VCBS repeat-containing protein
MRFSFSCLAFYSAGFLISASQAVYSASPVITNGVAAVAAGDGFTAYLEANGSLYTTGINQSGQLGTDAIPSRTNFGYVASGVKSVACGANHVVFVKNDESLWAMGDNQYGQLGDGSTTPSFVPKQILASGVASVSAGSAHSLFVKTDGSLWAMGRNIAGQLGDDSDIDRYSPVVVVVSSVVSASAGYRHSLYLKTDGSLWGMGVALNGALGSGSTDEVLTPIQIIDSGVSSASAGRKHSLFLKTDGSLWSMGYNASGQLGDGSTINRNTPFNVATSGVNAISAGGDHSLYVKADGSLWGMGNNTDGQLGDGSMTNRLQSVSIVSSDVISVTAGNLHSLYAMSTDLLKAMGRNAVGEFGNGTTNDSSTPVTVLYGDLRVTMSEDGEPTAWSAPPLVATDADSDALIWSLASPPANGSAGVSGTGASPSTFIYSPNANFEGVDSFIAQVSDGSTTDTITVTVVVEAVSDPPVITQGAAVSVTMSEDGSPVAWSSPGLTASDPDGDLLTWSSSMNATNGTTSISGEGTSPSFFTYAPNAGFFGADSFLVEVYDGITSAFVTVNVTVLASNDAPFIPEGEEVSASLNEDETLDTLNAPSITAFDPDGDILTWSLGSSPSSGVAVLSGTGATPATFTYTPNSNFHGTDSFVAMVKDGDLNDTVTINLLVSPVNDAPVVTQGSSVAVTMSENSSPTAWVVPTLTASDADDDSIEWSLYAAPANGFASVTGIGDSPSIFTYWPNNNYSGIDSFIVKASDGVFSTNVTVGVSVLHVNVPPAIDQGESVSVSMSEDGFPISWSAPPLTVTDPDSSNVLTWNLATLPSSGLATVNGAGSNPLAFTYTPNANFVGSDSFVVQVDDGNATDSIAVNVTVNPVNDAPAIDQETAISVIMNENGVPLAWATPSLNASDVDGDELTWIVFHEAINGTVDLSGTGPSPDVLTYTPNTDFTGSDSFVVAVSDGNSFDQITINVSILGVNYPPLLSADFALSVTMSEDGSPASWAMPNISASDPDVEDTLTWSTSIAPIHGTATVSGNGGTPSQLVYEPDSNYFGSDSFTISVSDGNVTDEVAINVKILAVNDDPVIIQGDSLSVILSEDSFPHPWVEPTLTVGDFDSADVLAWSVLTPPVNGVASVAGTGASPTTFTYSPNANWSGSDSFEIGVSDGTTTDSITVNLTVTPINDAPVIAQGSSVSVSMSEEGTPISWIAPELSATDEEGDELSWSMSLQPSHGVAAVQGVGGVPTLLTYAPELNFAGDDSFVVSVTDGNSSSFLTVNVSVANVNDPLSIDQGQSIAFTMSEDGFPVPGVVPVLTVSDLDVADVYTWTTSTSPFHGSVEIAGNSKELDQLTYAPNASWSGIDSFVVQVSDGTTTDSITVQVTVAPVDDAPVIAQGEAVTAFMSEDGSPVPWATPRLSAFDEDGDELTWEVLTQASHGVATMLGGLSEPSGFEYEPEANFAGEDSFVISVTDGNNTDSITVNVIVANVNDLPIINQGESIEVTMSEDGSPVAWQAPVLTVSDADAGGVFSWSILAPPGHGVASVGGLGAIPSSLSYTPASSWSGVDSFWVQVSDGTASDSITVQVTVVLVNAPPAIAQGETVTVYMSENGFPFSWTAPKLSAFDEDGDELSWKILTQPAHGVADLAGDFIHPSGLGYEPFTNFEGEDSFVLSVTDGNLSDSITVNVIVTNDNIPPSIEQGGSLIVVMSEDGLPISWSPPKLSATDLNGDTLTWSLSKLPSHGLAGVSGQGEKPSLFTYEPNLKYSGKDSFSVQVSDGNLNAEVRIDITLLEVSDLPSSFEFRQIGLLYENCSVGTIVGTFASSEVIGITDLTFSLAAEANGSILSNALFSLEANGTLKSKEPLNYEAHSNPQISVRLSNAIGEAIDQTFSIVLSDVFLPSVNTSVPTDVTAISATLHGMVEDFGEDPQGVSVRGFVLGSTPDPFPGDLGAADLPAGSGTGAFDFTAEGLSPGSIYYFRSYAINSEGSRYGPQRRFVTAKHESFGSLVNAIDKKSGWWSSEWFGDFYATGRNWIYHADFGWLFVYGDSPENLWLWQRDLGWTWVSNVSFPYFYSSKLSNWLLWKQTTGNVAVFFDYSQSNWISYSLVTSP